MDKKTSHKEARKRKQNSANNRERETRDFFFLKKSDQRTKMD